MSVPVVSVPVLTFLPPSASSAAPVGGSAAARGALAPAAGVGAASSAARTGRVVPVPAPLPAPPTEVDRLLDSAAIAAMVGKHMKGGDTVTITSDGRVVLEVHKDEVSALDQFRYFARDALRATAREASNVVAQDPSFAFKEAAFAVKGQVYAGMPTDLTSMADQAFLPMIRVVATALDVARTIKTWKSEQATRGDRVVDGSHLVTDVVGVGGAVAFALPGVGPGVAVALTTVGVVGDVAAYGYHVMKYFRNRGRQQAARRG